MKKLFFLFILLTPMVAMADTQNESPFNVDQLVFNATLVAILYLASTFIISLIKMRFDTRFKDKLIESERSEEVISRLLQPVEKERKDESFRAMAILGGIGLGFALAYATRPLGLHSVAIMGFCLAFSFLAYYLYLKDKENKPTDHQ